VAVDWQELVVLQHYACGLSIARANEHWTRGCSQQSTTPGLHPVSIHQMALPPSVVADIQLLLINLKRMKG